MRPILLLLTILGAGAALAGAPGGAQPSTAVLVKSRVPLTDDVVASITAHATRVSWVWPEIDALAMTLPPSKWTALVAHPDVLLVEPDALGSAPAPEPTFTVEPQALQIPLARSHAVAWNQDLADTIDSGFDGSGVTVAVVDSGLPQNWREFLPEGSVDTTHAAGFGAQGWGDFHNDPNAVPGNGGYLGQFPHGLAVSSVIVGFPSESGPVGGAAPGATILPIRVLGQFNTGFYSWFAAALLYVAELKSSGAIDGPLVVNFSIQGGSGSFILADAIYHAIEQGVIFVTIAGNFGPRFGSIAFPGRLPESITVGAVGWTGIGDTPTWYFDDVPEDPAVRPEVYVTEFSGRDFTPPDRIDVLGPGEWVVGEWLAGNGRSLAGYSEGRARGFDGVEDFLFGTSFAAPHVAGIAAQMLQKNPDLTQSEVEALLRGTAIPIQGDPLAVGRGLASGRAAVAAVP